jgi:hypothetical protein
MTGNPRIKGEDPAPRLDRAGIAKRAARDLIDGSTVNLGIGIPALCADFLPDGVELLYHAENGILGFKELSAPGEGDPNMMDAGGKFPKLVPGMAFFDSVESFALIRGGHIDVTVLGALQVSWADPFYIFEYAICQLFVTRARERHNKITAWECTSNKAGFSPSWTVRRCDPHSLRSGMGSR